MMKMSTDTTTGIPSPPFRMMAPKGAPMKKKMRQASDKVILLCHSVSCLRMRFSPSVTMKLLKAQSPEALSLELKAELSTFFLSSKDRFW